MRLRDVPEADRIAQAIGAYETSMGPLPGIANGDRRSVLIEQMIESLRRVRWVRHFLRAHIGQGRLDPTSGIFDPIKAAILHTRAGNPEEACWLVFLFTHFGKPRKIGWQHVADIYGALGADPWDWPGISGEVNSFRQWLADNLDLLRERPHGFGSHRKYESLGAWSPNGTGAIVASYVEWVAEAGNHVSRFGSAVEAAGGDARAAFGTLFASMKGVRRFGRTARFDYLSMISKLELSPITPDSAHIAGSTGPLVGARLLFDHPSDTSSTATDLEDRAIALESFLGIGFDPLEDSLCNWQKSPDVFKPFRG